MNMLAHGYEPFLIVRKILRLIIWGGRGRQRHPQNRPQNIWPGQRWPDLTHGEMMVRGYNDIHHKNLGPFSV